MERRLVGIRRGGEAPAFDPNGQVVSVQRPGVEGEGLVALAHPVEREAVDHVRRMVAAERERETVPDGEQVLVADELFLRGADLGREPRLQCALAVEVVGDRAGDLGVVGGRREALVEAGSVQGHQQRRIAALAEDAGGRGRPEREVRPTIELEELAR